MPISRRSLLRNLGVGAVTGTAMESFTYARVLQPPPGSGQLTLPVLLDHNENAYGPSEKVLAVLAEAPSCGNRYQRQEYEVLRTKLAALHAVKEDQILLGCGSTEILRLSAMAFTGPGKKLVQAVPTYGSIRHFAQTMGAEIVEVPITRNYEHDLATMLARAANSAGLVYICNPNNPTATLTVRKDIEDFLQKLPQNLTVLIDEAYSHFVNPHLNYASFLDRLVNDPRFIVCRTFSKVYGLAGMRIGYAVGASELLRKLSATQLRYGISTIAARAASAALDDTGYVSLAVKRNANDRQEFFNQVNARMLHAIDSHTNFALMDPLRPVDMVIGHLKQNNVLVAPPIASMPKYLRVSFGTPVEMQEFWRVVDLLPPTGKMAM